MQNAIVIAYKLRLVLIKTINQKLKIIKKKAKKRKNYRKNKNRNYNYKISQS